MIPTCAIDWERRVASEAREYSWPHITEQYLAVYEAATARRHRARRARRSSASN